jgi:hypothetical protein
VAGRGHGGPLSSGDRKTDGAVGGGEVDEEGGRQRGGRAVGRPVA